MGSRVLLVEMPFGSLRWPSPAIGLLKASLRESGVDCDAAHFTFDLAERIGADLYEWIADAFAFVLGGDRLFAPHYFDADRLPSDEAYLHDVLLHEDPEFSSEDRDAWSAVAAAVAPFLDDCARAIDWSTYDAVGFTVSFQQTLPSLALAKRIRAMSDRPRILFGGAACDGVMGGALLRAFPEIDYVFTGEADRSLAELMRALEPGDASFRPPGVLSRDANGADDETPLVTELDPLPPPDYDDYFARLARSPLRDSVEPLLLFETSRGCWWGQTHHCHFCGLNGGRMPYRCKSPRRVVEEAAHLVQRYGVHRACTTDNVFDPRYFKELLPVLAESGLGLEFEQELRTTMSREQIDALLRAGLAAAQLGVETFNSRILHAIDKGARAVDNVRTLKWLTEAGAEVHWNFLYGFPQERPDDYAEMPSMIDSLAHLTPPIAVGPVRLDRFSPYFDEAERFGLRNVRPKPAFRHAYALDDVAVREIAYYFDFDFADGRDVTAYMAPTLDAVERWRAGADFATLRWQTRDDGVLLVTDTRPAAVSFQHRMTGWERDLYLACDAGLSMDELLAAVEAMPEEQRPAEATWRRAVERWEAERLAVTLDGLVLALAMRTPE